MMEIVTTMQFDHRVYRSVPGLDVRRGGAGKSDFFPMLANGSHYIERQGERAAAVLEGNDGRGSLADGVEE